MADFAKLCSSCKTQGCCTNSAVPLVFSADFEDLKSINKATDEFLHDRNVNGSIIKAVNKKKNSNNCIFWDEENKNCAIYEHRPFDCRAYPFDILKIDGKYHWIVYSCNPQSDGKNRDILGQHGTRSSRGIQENAICGAATSKVLVLLFCA